MAVAPHITIGHHPAAGVVAATTGDHHVTDHLLRRVGFEPVPDSRLYTLSEPHRDPLRRTQLAVQSLRAARQQITADAVYDLHPGEPLPSPLAPGAETARTAASPARRRAQAALATSPARKTPSSTPPSSAVAARDATPTAAPRPARTR